MVQLKTALKYLTAKLPIWLFVAALCAWKTFWKLHKEDGGAIHLAHTPLRTPELEHEQDSIDRDSNDSLHAYQQLRDEFNKGIGGGND